LPGLFAVTSARNWRKSYGEDVNINAHHEAGHAVAAYLLRLEIAAVSVRPNESTDGRLYYSRSNGIPTDEQLEAAIQVDFAGSLAEDRARCGNLRYDYWKPTERSFEAPGGRSDREHAHELCLLLANDDEDAAARIEAKVTSTSTEHHRMAWLLAGCRKCR
jgi:hypothetical protein